MKQLLFFLLLFLIGVAGCNETPKERELRTLKEREATASIIKPIITHKIDTTFHLKIKNWGDCEHWVITFTNNEWITENEIMDAFDITMDHSPIDVPYQTMIFFFYKDALGFSKRLTTYKSCIMNNEHMKLRHTRLIEYYKSHPPKKTWDDEFKKPCKESDMQEEIIR